MYTRQKYTEIMKFPVHFKGNRFNGSLKIVQGQYIQVACPE